MRLELAQSFEEIKEKYRQVIENTPEMDRYARWIYGQHPTEPLLRKYLEEGELYVLRDGTEIAGMMAVVMYQGQDYEAVSWEKHLANDRVATVHILAVCPAYQRKGLGGRLLGEAAELGRRSGKRALRLDALESNLPARQLYEKAGFKYRGKEKLFAENTGWTNFCFYERSLEES